LLTLFNGEGYKERQTATSMKSCPQCRRTYSDNTISFCLADGQLLSSTHDPAATLPLTPAYETAGAITETVISPEQAKRKIRRNWIAGAVGVPVGVIIVLVQFSTMPGSQDQPLATLALAAALSGLIYGYLFWTAFWGFPKVWRWWQLPVRKLYALANRIEFNTAVTIVLALVGLCALVPALALILAYFYALVWVGLFYSFFGGGVYQFIQTRRIALMTE
jgi:hypothetical protein